MESSCDGKMVLRSRQNAELSVYPTMAGVPMRRALDSLFREIPVGLMVMAMEGI